MRWRIISSWYDCYFMHLVAIGPQPTLGVCLVLVIAGQAVPFRRYIRSSINLNIKAFDTDHFLSNFVVGLYLQR